MTVFARVNGSEFELEDRGQSGKNEVKVSCFGKHCVVFTIYDNVFKANGAEIFSRMTSLFRFQVAGRGTIMAELR